MPTFQFRVLKRVYCSATYKITRQILGNTYKYDASFYKGNAGKSILEKRVYEKYQRYEENGIKITIDGSRGCN